MLTKFKRVFHLAFVSFYRNKGMSAVAVLILIITSLLVASLFLIQGASDFLIDSVRDKIDITAYFKSDVKEEEIIDVKDELLKNSSGIKNIEYVSSQDALNDFLEKHKDNPVFSRALSEVGDNPFLPALNITTNGDPASYEQISRVLENDQWDNIIEKVDFPQKRDIIEKVFYITSRVESFILGLSVILVLISVIVVFNTIKLIVDASGEEISTMRIVGGGDWFVRLPFIIQGAIFGLISSVISILLTLALTSFFSPDLASVLPGFNLFNYSIANIWTIAIIQMGFGIGLGSIASFVVVRKHLKV